VEREVHQWSVGTLTGGRHRLAWHRRDAQPWCVNDRCENALFSAQVLHNCKAAAAAAQHSRCQLMSCLCTDIPRQDWTHRGGESCHRDAGAAAAHAGAGWALGGGPHLAGGVHPCPRLQQQLHGGAAPHLGGDVQRGDAHLRRQRHVSERAVWQQAAAAATGNRQQQRQQQQQQQQAAGSSSSNRQQAAAAAAAAAALRQQQRRRRR
jgi:hypothetical protein